MSAWWRCVAWVWGGAVQVASRPTLGNIDFQLVIASSIRDAGSLFSLCWVRDIGFESNVSWNCEIYVSKLGVLARLRCSMDYVKV